MRKYKSIFPLPLRINPSFDSQWIEENGKTFEQSCLFLTSQHGEKYVATKEGGELQLWYFQNATNEDVLRGLHHASLLRAKAGGSSHVEDTYRQMSSRHDALCDQLKSAGWSTDDMDLNHQRCRLQFVEK